MKKSVLYFAIITLFLFAGAVYGQTLNIKFSWLANPPADGVTGYKLHLGPAAGTYTEVLDVGNNLSKVVPDNPAQRAAAVSAYNADGISSDLSPAKIFRPQQPGAPIAVPTAAAPAN